ncbi:autotransporter domain-containing protein [Erwinia tracheiphila]|uniref:Autotransporter outer membrane beta-barrel domain-containing protein n=2 Tax=Erwinia tracheiphila TaxID=65700 RepID=A0A345CQR6_9GAMM|nr:autotransporter outer membrane beta-barrel domain-containing protein [Erwinia tracheiphila]AXF75783.1 autotransporter outer membrane beta-barrel domain-containing protein [Erwinia tracheiphila]UIA81670.1 autotransporter domain-containing protein [Erwinia tracheiphila]UIA94091.1 autotransporter domain-containing protein [Erwinia tracheiphila]
MKRFFMTTALIGLLASNNSYAGESYLVYNPQNIAVFQVRFFNVGDGPFMPGWPGAYESTWDLGQQQKEKILDAMRYWAEVITPRPGQLPAIINVGTFNDENAEGSSDSVTDSIISLTQLQGALNSIDTGELTFGSHAQFIMGKMDFDDVPYVPAQLPRTGKTDLVSVAVHELAHGLGISNMVTDLQGSGTFTPTFNTEPFGSWTSHLRDNRGNPARPGQVILCNGCNNPWDPQGFDVRLDKGYFTGRHVDEVLAGTMPGVPVKMLGDDGSVDDNYMSHIELKNSMMSHQNYRNYTTFMEAGLALLQDMGYQIDRRNFFGFSLYGNGQTLINRNGYFLRNQQGDGYLAGQYNTATLGVGLHVYGSNNHIFQQADLLTQGAGGAGVRIDGQNNTLSIEPGTRVYADGLNGRGVMFSYGKQHNLIQRGDIQALGANGVAISFNFGNNLLGNEVDYRGSWLHIVDGYNEALLPELQGALVDNADISGRVAGKGAAIYISPNALVSNINILNGARLEGDIYADYAQRDAYGQQRLTQLTFGRKANAYGQATEAADSDFSFTYRGNIEGINNLVLNAHGGKTSLNGDFQIYSMTIAPGAILSGNGSYTLNEEGRFVNSGILAPGNSLGQINISGAYQQTDTGQLLLEVDGRGRHDTLRVDGHAQFSGQLTFVPQPGWYTANWRLDSQDLLKTDSYSGEFSTVNSLLRSPTLTLQTMHQGENSWQLSIRRASNAYSQYAQDDNALQVGQALDKIVAEANSDIQPLYRTLDFSATDGGSISNALPQLSAGAYSAMFASSLHREQQITRIIGGPDPVVMPKQLVEGEWRSFAIPFGGGFWQQRQGDSVGYEASSYGMVFGAEKQNDQNHNWIYGFHGAVSGQSVTVKSPETATGKTTAFDLGIHARYGAERSEGMYLFGTGRFGIEESWLDRNIHVETYEASHHATWTGLSGSVTAGGGYRWALNDNVNAGPITSLNYTILHRPGVKENGNDGSRLVLGSETFNTLRSSIGVNGNWNVPLASGASITAELQLTWDHELLDGNVVQQASFAHYRSTGFSSRNQVTGRDALGVKAGMSYKINTDVELGIGIESELFHSGYDSIIGNLSATWRF